MSSGFEKDFAQSYGGFARRLMVRQLVLVGGFMLQLEVKDSGRFRYVLLPELCGAGGWVDISRKFWVFLVGNVQRVSLMADPFQTSGGLL